MLKPIHPPLELPRDSDIDFNRHSSTEHDMYGVSLILYKCVSYSAQSGQKIEIPVR